MRKTALIAPCFLLMLLLPALPILVQPADGAEIGEYVDEIWISPQRNVANWALDIDDVDSDGDMEIIVGGSKNATIIDATTKKIEWYDPSVYSSFDARSIDLDGDGGKELVLAYANGLHVLSGNSREHLWEASLDGLPTGGVSFGNIDNDTSIEIVVATNTRVYAFDWEAKRMQWNFSLDSNTIRGIEIADIDKDGKNDLVFTATFVYAGNSIASHVYVYDPQTVQSKWKSPEIEGYVANLIVADTDVDGDKEIIVATSVGMYFYNGYDKELEYVNHIITDANTMVSIDLDNSGKEELVVGRFNGFVSIFDFDGERLEFLWGTNDLGTIGQYDGIAVGDLDGDGNPEIVFGTYQGYLYIYGGVKSKKLLGFSPQSPRAGNDLEVSVYIFDDEPDEENVHVELFVGYSTTSVVNKTFSNNGSNTQIAVLAWTPQTPGLHLITAKLHYKDGRDVEASGRIHVEGPKDLAVSITAPPPSEIRYGDMLELIVEVENLGGEFFADVLVRIYDGDRIIFDKIIPLIAPNASEEFNVGYIIKDYNAHDFRVEVDPMGLKSDIDRTNNLHSVAFSLNRPDTSLTTFQITQVVSGAAIILVILGFVYRTVNRIGPAEIRSRLFELPLSTKLRLGKRVRKAMLLPNRSGAGGEPVLQEGPGFSEFAPTEKKKKEMTAPPEPTYDPGMHPDFRKDQFAAVSKDGLIKSKVSRKPEAWGPVKVETKSERMRKKLGSTLPVKKGVAKAKEGLRKRMLEADGDEKIKTAESSERETGGDEMERSENGKPKFSPLKKDDLL